MLLTQFEDFMIAELDKRCRRRKLVDRRAVVTRNLIRLLVWNWTPMVAGSERLQDGIITQVKRQYRSTFEFNPLVLMIIQALLNVLVQIFIHWWINRDNDTVLVQLQEECRQYNIRG